MRVSSGLNKRERHVAFDEHFNDLITFKAKYGHCDVVSCIGEDASDPIRSKCNVHIVHGSSPPGMWNKCESHRHDTFLAILVGRELTVSSLFHSLKFI